MKGPWNITQKRICGEYMYAVYRLFDVQKIDHEGNRDYGSGWFGTEAEAQAVLDGLKRGAAHA